MKTVEKIAKYYVKMFDEIAKEICSFSMRDDCSMDEILVSR